MRRSSVLVVAFSEGRWILSEDVSRRCDQPIRPVASIICWLTARTEITTMQAALADGTRRVRVFPGASSKPDAEGVILTSPKCPAPGRAKSISTSAKMPDSTVPALRTSGNLASMVSTTLPQVLYGRREVSKSALPLVHNQVVDGRLRTLILRGEHGNTRVGTITCAAVRAAEGGCRREGSSANFESDFADRHLIWDKP